MKTFKTTLGTLAVLCLAASANAQIRGSGHDFSGNSWSDHEICKPCHTPHFANAEAGALWNHALTNATYTLFEGDPGTVADFDRNSRLCMSCHDGTVAIDSFGGSTSGTEFIDAGARTGTDLRDDHPIGREAVYPTATSTRFNPQDANHQIPGPTGTTSKLRLQSYTPAGGTEQFVVGCSTCHQVHNAGNFEPMLRFSNDGSALCLACHIK